MEVDIVVVLFSSRTSDDPKYFYDPKRRKFSIHVFLNSIVFNFSLHPISVLLFSHYFLIPSFQTR